MKENELLEIKGYSSYLCDINKGKIFKKPHLIKNQFGTFGQSKVFELKGTKKDGYIFGSFKNDDGIKIFTSFHRMIMMAHLGYDIPDGFIVDHNNTRRDDNRIDNLRLSSYSDNTKNISNRYVIEKIYLEYSDEELKNENFIDLSVLGFPFNLENNIRFISNLGRIKFFDKRKKCWRIHSPYFTSSEQRYPLISFNIKGKRYSYKWHMLVFKSFINPNIDFLDQINVIEHKDNNKLNCRLSNLELITRKENTIRYFKNFKKDVFDCYNQGQTKKYTKEDFEEMFDLFYNKNYTVKQLIEKYNHVRIEDILKGKTYKRQLPNHLFLLTPKFKEQSKINFQKAISKFYNSKPDYIRDTNTGKTYNSYQSIVNEGLASYGGLEKYFNKMKRNVDVSSSKYKNFIIFES